MSNEIKNIQVKGTPLIKFQNEDKIFKLRQGIVYANKLSYYRKLEEETGDMNVGDSFEAMIHVNEAIIRCPETGEEELLHDELIRTIHSDDYVFCLFAIYPNSSEYSFTDIQKKELLSFGDTALIITDSDEFISRVKSAAKKEGYQVTFKAVQYYEPSIDNANIIFDIYRDISNIAFWKRDHYSYQQEGRFVFSNGDMSLDHLELYIGDISDISEVVSVESALSARVEKQ